MHATRCACGFEQQDDEQLNDHLGAVFEPEDSTGTDGQVHLEGATLKCLCGLSAGTPEELDAHFLAVFAPANAIGRDGREHKPIS